MEKFYNSMDEAGRKKLLLSCKGQFTEDYAEREAKKNWNQLPIFVQNAIIKRHVMDSEQTDNYMAGFQDAEYLKPKNPEWLSKSFYEKGYDDYALYLENPEAFQ